MGKTLLTKKIENILYRKYGYTLGTFICFEVQFGFHVRHGEREFVDAATYSTNGELVCFEIKVSTSDFHSKAKTTFIGNKNYYVMPLELYEKVKDEIPPEIGVQVLCDSKEHWDKETGWHRTMTYGTSELVTVKPCKKQATHKFDENTILWSFVRSSCNGNNGEIKHRNTEFTDIEPLIREHLAITDGHGKRFNLKNYNKIKDRKVIELYVDEELMPEDFNKLLHFIAY